MDFKHKDGDVRFDERLGRERGCGAKFQAIKQTHVLKLLFCVQPKVVSRMCLPKAVRDQLISNYQGIINDRDVLLLYDLNTSNHIDLPYNSYENFDFDILEEDECMSEFRFHKSDIPLLAEMLQIPDRLTLYQRSVCSGLEALCIVLKRLAYPCRYADMVAKFSRPVPVLCIINNHLMDYIYQTQSQRILQWNNTVMNPHALQAYADAITSIVATSVAESNPSTTINANGKQSSLHHLSSLSKKVADAEILWALNSVDSHFSASSNVGMNALFKTMFSDSEVASLYFMSESKYRYMTTFGIGPQFSKLLLADVKASPAHCIMFDESLNSEL
ncbi:predicted protein [Nematostella vectensis]|uniref:Uncharacterized protein n=1 Tax=Nematostella vectensis TaxID=45351 RepID=A7SKZ1_NEMVE|nr:predicted protein [Nematostella vectensis]|eukprot:XP_001627700.1 predicted protein [Nematostella vectensis]